MKFFTRSFLVMALILICAASSYSSHMIGGDISWRANANGSFTFKLKIYRDCRGVPGPAFASLATNAPSGTINMSLIAVNDLGPLAMTTCTLMGPGAVEEFIFESNPVFLSGTPPPQGWYFAYTTCCRSASTTNIVNPGSLGMTIVAIMYPYPGFSTNPSYDSSPEFPVGPVTVFCTGAPITVGLSALDPDADSLVYSWAESYDSYNTSGNLPGNLNTIPYNTGFSFNNPLPGPEVLDSSNGLITFTPNMIGFYLTAIKVRSYKNGILVSENYREMTYTLESCIPIASSGPNNAPVAQAPFQDSSGQQNRWTKSVMVGDTVLFNLNLTDFDLGAAGASDIVLRGHSTIFGDSVAHPGIPCLSPPCAGITPALPIGPVPLGLSASVEWITDCSHLVTGLARSDNQRYDMTFNYMDRYAPTPAPGASVVTVFVKDLKVLRTPVLNSLSQNSNGDVTLHWAIPNDPDATFRQYNIYYSTTAGGPYTLLDSVMTYNQGQYTHVGSMGATQSIFYAVTAVSQNTCQSKHESHLSNKLGSTITTATPFTDSELPVDIFPNPTTGLIRLSFDQSMTDLSIQLYNQLGERITNQKYSGTTDYSLFVSGPAGIYYLILEDASGNRAGKKIIKL